MPRRELLTSAERLQLLAFPDDPSELIRLTALSPSDLAFVQQHRGDHNRLGVAVLLSYRRYPGRVLGEHEEPYEPVGTRSISNGRRTCWRSRVRSIPPGLPMSRRSAGDISI